MKKSTALAIISFLAASIVTGCSKSNSGGGCTSPDLDNPEQFVPCEKGSGAFGKWIVDEFGLPAYEYTLKQESDKRALFWNSELKERREHWHQVGNFRITALAYNDGYVQMLNEERGLKYLNRFDEATGNYSGGFGYIKDGGDVWCEAYKWRPAGSSTRRVFGLGYLMQETEHGDVKVRRHTYAPYGDDPLLVSEVRVTNAGGAPKNLSHYEYWDVNQHLMPVKPIASGMLDPGVPARNEEDRSALNEYFSQSARWDAARSAMFIDTALKYPKASELNIRQPWQSNEYDLYPSPVFLGMLGAKKADGTGIAAGTKFFLDQSEFFGAGGPNVPSGPMVSEGIEVAVAMPSKYLEVDGSGQPLCLVHVQELSLQPGESAVLKYAYGYDPSKGVPGFFEKYRGFKNGLEESLAMWKERLALFTQKSEPYLHREMAWHSYYLQSAAQYQDYYKTHIVNQGGAYLLGHAGDGATRDYSIFSVPLNYINPELSKDVLKYIMETCSEDGQLSYFNGGYGQVVATGVHESPSDLDIFFLWAMGEYLLATKDYGFLDERIPYYSPDGISFNAGNPTVLDHVRKAYDHLVNTVGTTEEGLVRLGDGDWSDGILLFSRNPVTAKERGGSMFNTAMAAAVLPTAAEAVMDADPALAERLEKVAGEYRTALKRQWNGKWFRRISNGDGTYEGDDSIFLEPQTWALIAGIPGDADSKALVANISNLLEKGSPLGARMLYPAREEKFGAYYPGNDVNGGIWPAVNSFLTWAYSRDDARRAWSALNRNTLASHASAYPNLWYGIWSGPDSYNAPESSRPGEAAAHVATSLTDYPVMNANAHANPLLALIKVAGIKPTRDGFDFAPALPLAEWRLDLPILGIRVKPGSVSGYFKALRSGKIKVRVEMSGFKPGATPELEIDGSRANMDIIDGRAVFTMDAPKDARISWEISY